MIQTLKCCSFRIANLAKFEKQVLNWLKPFSIFCFLDNQQYTVSPHYTECLVAVDVRDFAEGKDIKRADDFLKKQQWTFGHLSYELKNRLHHLSSTKEDKIGFPLFYFFSPQIVLEIKDALLVVHAEEPEKVFKAIQKQSTEISKTYPLSIQPQPVLSKEEYTKKIKVLQEHIHRGDCYEINFCQEFFAKDVAISPFAVFRKLMAISPNPFSALYRLND